VRRILRFDNNIYLIVVHQIILIDPDGKIKKIIETNDTLVDAFFYNRELYTLGFIQKEPYNSQNTSKNFISYVSVYDPYSLSLISKKEFKDLFQSFMIFQGRIFVGDFFNSKLYEIKNDNLTQIYSFLEDYPQRLYLFNDKIIVIGRKQLYIFDPKTNIINRLSNGSTCDFYVDGIIYNNKLYTICFSRNKTFVFDLNSRKLVNEINTTYPFYITVFGNRVYVTSVVSKKLYVIDPTSNSVIKELVFKEGPRVIG
jgi:YVTN family beta-propeller protein